MQTSEKVYKRKLKVLEIPDFWYDKSGKKFMTQERGQKSYVIRALDDFVHQYRVMQKIVKDSPQGFVEMLDGQPYQKFLTMQEAVEHFF